MSRLRYEENTCFMHNLWDRYYFLGTLDLSTPLWDRDFTQRDKYKYSIVQDSFYALSGSDTRQIRNNKTIEAWNNVRMSRFFEDCQNLFRTGGDTGKVSALAALSDFMEQSMQKSDEKREVECQSGTQSTPKPDQDKSDQSSQSKDKSQQNQQNNNQQQNQGTGKSQQLQPSQQEQQNNSQAKSGSQPGQEPGQEPTQTPSNRFGYGDSNPIETNMMEELEQGFEGFDESEMVENPGPELADINPQATKVGINREFTMSGSKQRSINPQQYKEILDGILPFVCGDNKAESISNAMRVANRLDIKNLQKFLGFARNATRAAKAKGVNATGEMTKYKHTTWDEKLHPVDMAGVVRKNPITLSRMEEGNLRTRQYEDISPQGRGPVIIMRDESSSMAGDKHRNSLEMEISLAIAFEEQGRELVSIPWDHMNSRIYVYGSGKNDRTFESHVNSFYNGGTTISHAIQRATVFSKEYMKGADIFILTDGEIGEQPEQIKRACSDFKESGGRIWLCFVLSGSYESERLGQHKIWADGVIRIDQINQSDALYQMLSQTNAEELGDRIRL